MHLRFGSADLAVPSYAIRVPAAPPGAGREEECCEVLVDGSWQRLRLSDQRTILRLPGLYEQLFVEQLQCTTPERATTVFGEVLFDWSGNPSDLRVLEIGAGNGVVAAELRQLGAGTVVGVDHRPEAADAAHRDRPGMYDEYIVARLSGRQTASSRRIAAVRPNCLFMLAPDEHGDLSPATFTAAWNMLRPSGWAVFSVSEHRNAAPKPRSFSRLLKKLVDDGCIQMESYRRYVHRLSVGGVPLCHVLFVARKLANVAA